MTVSASFRAMTDDDIALVTAAEQRYMHDIEPEHETRWLAATERNQRLWLDNLERAAVLQVDDSVAGYELWARDGKDATLVTINVRPEYRRQGLGRLLVSRFVSDAAACGCTTLRLGVHRNNPVRGLYEQAGFVLDRPDGDYLLYVRRLQFGTGIEGE